MSLKFIYRSMRGSVHWAFCVRLDEQKWALAQHFAHGAEAGKWPSKGPTGDWQLHGFIGPGGLCY
jgi:hypothetical protein